MRQSKVEILVDMHELAAMGPFETISRLRALHAALRLLVDEAKNRRPSLAILIDFAGFNLRLAKKLKALNIPVIYFIGPQVWASRSGRIRKMKETIDRLFVILPFEKEFYARFGMEVDYIGHPLLDRVKTSSFREDFFRKYGLNSKIPVISLLPGSRLKEIKFNLPVIAQTVQRLGQLKPIQFLLPLASPLHGTLVRTLLAEVTPQLPITLIEHDTYNAIGHSDLAVVCCGTATLETALLGVPLVAIYRVSNPTWIFWKCTVHVPFGSLVNLIAGKQVVPELLQKDFNVDKLYIEIKKYLDDPCYSAQVRAELARLKFSLGQGGAIERAVDRIWERVNLIEEISGRNLVLK
jgi:lipid-A-disaccharide synthase